MRCNAPMESISHSYIFRRIIIAAQSTEFVNDAIDKLLCQNLINHKLHFGDAAFTTKLKIINTCINYRLVTIMYVEFSWTMRDNRKSSQSYETLLVTANSVSFAASPVAFVM